MKQQDTPDTTEPVCACTGPARPAHDQGCPVRLAHPRVDLGDAPRPPDVHSRLQDLVDDHFGVRPTTSIEGLLTILEAELADALGPAMVSTCTGCGEEVDEPHTWHECHAVLKARLESAK